MVENEKKEEAALSSLLELETKCPECKGNGYWEGRGRCTECHGCGVVPTELGKRVLELFRHHRRTALQDDGW